MSTETSQIRIATPADVERLHEIERRCFADDRLSKRSLQRLASRPSAIMLVIEVAGGVAGYALALLKRRSTSTRLYSLAIDPGFAGRGVAQKLLAELEARLSARGYAAMTLEVRADNAAAVGLYQRTGWQRTGSIADYYTDGMTALRFAKPLAPSLRQVKT